MVREDWGNPELTEPRGGGVGRGTRADQTPEGAVSEGAGGANKPARPSERASKAASWRA